jgi:hypothetical protein
MVRTDRWKLIHYSHLDRWQLFDLETDPHELRDLSSNTHYDGIRAGLQHKLEAWFDPRVASLAEGDGVPARSGQSR